ncbi:hypothetical protein AAEX37_01678 [Oligella sp. MSHR50489EDL]|uniref:P-type ATPase n=1 Tax=Oligella sp. MSHR50489EDL TaxID=3139409 RepID=UPI003D8145EA
MKAVSIFAIPKDLPEHERLERRRMVVRLGLSWLIMMQVMMFAAPGYFKHQYMGTDIQESLEIALVLLNWIGLLLTIPVLFYCAVPIWKGLFAADRDFDHRHSMVNMNLPVALGIVVAFIPSVHTTIYHHGEVYYDSIVMFIAFLLTARYLEYTAVQSSYIGGEHSILDKIKRFRDEDMSHADRYAFYFVMMQIALAVVSGLIWYFYIDPAHALAVTVSLFVMSCPCAMAMSVPSCYAAARTVLLNAGANSQIDESFAESILQRTRNTARFCLNISIVFHLLMTLLAMIGLVSPWLAAIIMFVSSMWVGFMGWRLYKRFRRELEERIAD